MAELLILPALILGLVIGLYELILIHGDENFKGSHWFKHGLHAATFAIAGTFMTMNADWVYTTFNFLHTIPFVQNIIVFRIAIGLIMVIKIHSTSAVVKSTVGNSKGLKETWIHSLIVGALIVLAPYIWPYIAPMLAPYGIK